LPAAINSCGKKLYGAITHNNEVQYLGRVDYQISPRHTLFGRNMALPFTQPAPYALSGNILATTTAGLNNFFQNYVVGDTFLVNAATVSSFPIKARSVVTTSNPGVTFFC
jgi:hypothetical protein